MSERRSLISSDRFDAIVAGAGVFGSWTAEHLRRAGSRVLLVDQAGPANALASSGCESRMTRSSYGVDAIYTRMAHAALGEWAALSRRASLPLFHPAGALFVFDAMNDYASATIDVHRDLNLPLAQLDRAELARRWPQMETGDLAFGLHEPEFGALMARRAVQELVAGFVAAGGDYRLARAAPGGDGHSVLIDGETHQAEAIVYACGPWLPKLFPDLLGNRIFVTRQELAFIAPPQGDRRFGPDALPCWADLRAGNLYYGFPDLEARGFKLGLDRHGPPFDPDSGNRRMSEAGGEALRLYLAHRFPALAARPFSEFRVCQYENSSNGDFLIDRHPTEEGSFLLGAGSGHGFKHGPEVGRLMADLVLGRGAEPNPRFSLASKASEHRRAVM